MFQSFYHLREQPFGVNPDPRFLYLSKTHREAFSSLLYRIQTDSGFLAMIAPPGMGKTTLLFHLLHRLHTTSKTAFIFQTQCTSSELLRNLLSEFECDSDTTDAVLMFRQLKSFLVAEANAGRRCVLIVDEAQNLSGEVLETIRLLSNFETPRRKLLNIVLSGQAELSDVLSSAGMRQFRQRLSCIAYLQEFTPAETALYIAHRLEVAGYTGKVSDLFSIPSLVRIAHLSQGVPRVINNICFNALSLGYALDTKHVDVAMIDEVADDLGISKSERLHLRQSAHNREVQITKTPDQPHEDHADAETDIRSAVTTRQQSKAQGFAEEAKTIDLPAIAIPSEHYEAEIKQVAADHRSVEAEPAASIQEPESFFARPVEPAQISLKSTDSSNGAAMPAVAPDAHRISKGQFVVRSVVCVLILCVAPVSGIQLHQESAASAPLAVEKTPSSADIPHENLNKPNRAAASESLSPSANARGPKGRTRSKPSRSLLRHRHRGMSVDLGLAKFAPEPLIKAVPIRPISEPTEEAQRLATNHFVTTRIRSIPRNAQDNASYIPPKPIWQPAPTFIPISRSRHSTRDVQLMLSISSSGNVYKADVLKGNGELARVAERTADSWKYSPAVSNGVPVNSQVYVTIQFQQH